MFVFACQAFTLIKQGKELLQPILNVPSYKRCCNQVEMSPGLQSRSVTKRRDGSKA